MSEYFVLKDLDDGEWSVTWPGYENNVVNNPGKTLKLLEILFDHVGVEQAQVLVEEPDRNDLGHYSLSTWYISNVVWFEERSRIHMARDLARFTIPGVKFQDRYEAEKFKTHMEQRLAWKRLGGEWK